MHDRRSDSVTTLEINPRMASQFADLYEKVDGVNTYSLLLDIAAGREPKFTRGQGRHARAASCVLRTFHNSVAVKVPSRRDLDRLRKVHPDVRFEILTHAGRKLSQELQDGRSYRYGIVNLGGRDDADIADGLRDCLARLPFVLQPDEVC